MINLGPKNSMDEVSLALRCRVIKCWTNRQQLWVFSEEIFLSWWQHKSYGEVIPPWYCSLLMSSWYTAPNRAGTASHHWQERKAELCATAPHSSFVYGTKQANWSFTDTSLNNTYWYQIARKPYGVSLRGECGGCLCTSGIHSQEDFIGFSMKWCGSINRNISMYDMWLKSMNGIPRRETSVLKRK